jgi:hypothetical protein
MHLVSYQVEKCNAPNKESAFKGEKFLWTLHLENIHDTHLVVI